MLEGQQRVLSRYFFEKGLLRFTSSWRSTTDSFKTNPFIIFFQLYKLLLKAERIQERQLCLYVGRVKITKELKFYLNGLQT